MKCPNCGQENREIAQFCQHCGEPFQDVASSDIVSSDELEKEPAIVGGVSEAVAPATDEPERALPALEPDMVATEAVVGADKGVEEGAEPAPEHIAPDEQIEGPALPSTELEGGVLETTSQCAEPEEPEPGFAEPGLSEAAPGEQAESEPSLGFEAEEEEMTELKLEGGGFREEGEIAPAADKTLPECETESAIEEPSAEVEVEGAAEQAAKERLEEELATETADADGTQALADAGALFWRETPEPMEALEPGTVVHGRYQVSEVLSTEGREVLYRIRDLVRCAQCGFVDNSPDQAFCSSCGAVMDQKPLAMMLERPIERVDEPVELSAEDYFQEGDRLYWVWREFEETAPLEQVQRTMRFIVGQKSDVGRKRELDEDSLFVLIMEGIYESLADQLALFVVADGMGGHEGGNVASKLAIQALASELMCDVFTPSLEGRVLSAEEIQECMVKAMQAANDRVYLERKKRESDMGTTVTAALVKDWMLYLAHVGDSRAYRWGQDGLRQLTVDHSVIASMIAAGTVQPDEIYTHPQRSVIYRSVGDRPNVDVDSDVFCLNPGDRLILCCDGLWEMIRDEGIEVVMLSEPDPQMACDVMVERANMAGGVDNISVIVVQL